jgi:hypothetical protein
MTATKKWETIGRTNENNLVTVGMRKKAAELSPLVTILAIVTQRKPAK